MPAFTLTFNKYAFAAIAVATVGIIAHDAINFEKNQKISRCKSIRSQHRSEDEDPAAYWGGEAERETSYLTSLLRAARRECQRTLRVVKELNSKVQEFGNATDSTATTPITPIPSPPSTTTSGEEPAVFFGPERNPLSLREQLGLLPVLGGRMSGDLAPNPETRYSQMISFTPITPIVPPQPAKPSKTVQKYRMMNELVAHVKNKMRGTPTDNKANRGIAYAYAMRKLEEKKDLREADRRRIVALCVSLVMVPDKSDELCDIHDSLDEVRRSKAGEETSWMSRLWGQASSFDQH